MKKCKKCGRELPSNEFDMHKNVCKECRKQQQRQYYQNNADKKKQYYQENKDIILERQKQWNKEHKEERIALKKKWRKTPIGRASMLLGAYNHSDKKYNRGEGDLTAQWIVENIFTKPCVHCGVEGWQVIGCNRINNDLPHTKDNVEPCCGKCNQLLQKQPRNEFGRFMKTNGE